MAEAVREGRRKGRRQSETLRGQLHRPRRFTYDNIVHNDQINLNLIRLVGADRVVRGSDYCFDMGLPDPVGTVEHLSGLSDAERDLILGASAAKLLRL